MNVQTLGGGAHITGRRSAQEMQSVIAMVLLIAFVPISHAEPVSPQARECVGYLLHISDKEAPRSVRSISIAKYGATVFAASYSYESGISRQFIVTARHAVLDEKGAPASSLFAQFSHEDPQNVRLLALDPDKWLFHKDADRVDLAVYPGLPDQVRVIDIRVKNAIVGTRGVPTHETQGFGRSSFGSSSARTGVGG